MPASVSVSSSSSVRAEVAFTGVYSSSGGACCPRRMKCASAVFFASR